MRSPLGTLATLLNKAPVPYVGRHNSGMFWPRATGTEGYLRAMGSVGTLFAIVDRLATSTAAGDWALYRKTDNPNQRPEERVPVVRHLALDIWSSPNPFFTPALFVETFQQHYELVGEAIWVVARNPAMRSIPLELWPVRPDRMFPVPSRDDYLAGWVYTSPDGEQVPLQLDEVIQLRRPNPVDPYRGIGAVQTILADLEGVRLSAEWNRNFFANSAEPGGIVEIERRLSDDEFEELTTRWREQHQGVANAHRVAILEQGKWVDRKYSMRDMQFTELRRVSREVIREAFGITKFAIGDVEDINRATGEAAKAWFAEQMTVPRLERIKDALNTQFLPLFGTTGTGVEFDFASPVPSDREADDRERESKANAAKAMIESGAYGPAVFEALGLPEIPFGQPGADPDRELLIDLVKGAPTLAPMILPMLGYELPEQPAPAAPPAPAQEDTAAAARLGAPRALPAARPHLHARENRDDEESDRVRAGIRTDEAEALERLLADWEPLLGHQIDDLHDQIEAAVDDESAEGLGQLSVDAGETADLLRVALGAMAQTAAERMARECRAQGVDVTAPKVDEAVVDVAPGRVMAFGAELAEIATTVAELLASDLAAAAGREALRLYSPGASGVTVAERVSSFLSGLKGALRKSQLGAALHRATNLGRIATLKAALKLKAGGRVLAVEENDDNTCKPCADLDGYEFEDVAEAVAVYGTGGYYACDGRERCRGTFEGVWD